MFAISDEGARELSMMLKRFAGNEATEEDRASARALSTVIDESIAAIGDQSNPLIGVRSLLDVVEQLVQGDSVLQAAIEKHRSTCPCRGCAEWRRRRAKVN